MSEATFTAKFEYYKALEEKVIRRAREDSNVFTQYVFGFKNAPFHENWHRFLDAEQYGQILACRDTGKTEQVTIGRSLWEIGKNPGIRIKIATETDELVKKILTRIGNTIRKNERYHKVFPHIRPSVSDSWNKMSMTVENDLHQKDPTIEGGGVLTASVGGRADLLFFDDISGMRNAIHQPKVREQVKEAWANAWLNLLDGPLARWYMVGTPWHEQDIVCEVRHNPAIPHCKETWVGDNFESPWPERFPDEYFKKRLLVIKQRAYNRAYRGVAVTDSEAYINASAIEACIDRKLTTFEALQNKEVMRFTGIDLGHRDGDENSPTVIFTIGRYPNGKRIPLEIKKFQQKSILDTGRAIIDTWERLRPTLIFCENNGAQKYLTDLLRGLGPTGLPIEGYFTGQQKADVEMGVPSLLAEIESGHWVFPFGAGGAHDETCTCHVCYWLGEIRYYPLTHMDVLMASWFALEALRKIKERGDSQGGFRIWSWG